MSMNKPSKQSQAQNNLAAREDIPVDFTTKSQASFFFGPRFFLAYSFSLFLFFFSTDRPTITRGRAMGNETFYWEGLTILRKIMRGN